MDQGERLATVEFVDRHRSGDAIWRIAWPVMVMQALYTALSVVDMFWVGRLGPVAVAAVALGGSAHGVLFTVGQVFSIAVLALAARAAGQGDRRGVAESAKHALLAAGLFSLAPAAAGALLSGRILALLGATPEVVSVGAPYLAVLFGYLPVFYFGMVAYSVFQAVGDTRTPMLVTLAANVLNAVLDPVLIFGWLGFPRLGVTGAALATAACQSAGVLVTVLVLHRRGLLGLGPGLRWRTVRTVFAVGVPAGLQAVTRPVTGMLLFGLVTGFGVAATAAFGIGLRILGVMYVYLGGLGSAGEALVGQSLGRGRPDLAVSVSRRVTVLAFLVQLAVLPLVFLFAPLVTRLFNGDPGVVRFGTEYLRVLAPVLVLLGLSTGWASAQRGAGATGPPMYAALVSNWLVKLPVAWLLSRATGLGVTGVWVGIGVSIAVETVMVGLWYRLGNWQRKELAWN